MENVLKLEASPEHPKSPSLTKPSRHSRTGLECSGSLLWLPALNPKAGALNPVDRHVGSFACLVRGPVETL